MFEIDKNFCWRVREKRAREQLTKEKAAKEIGISRKTLSLVEKGKKFEVKKIVYRKIVNWLLEERK